MSFLGCWVWFFFVCVCGIQPASCFLSEFPPSKNHIAFTNVLQGKKSNWIVGVKVFLLKSPIYLSAKPEYVQPCY